MCLKVHVVSKGTSLLMGLQTNKSSSHASSFNSVHSPFKLHCGVANLYAFNVVYIFGKSYFLIENMLSFFPAKERKTCFSFSRDISILFSWIIKSITFKITYFYGLTLHKHKK